MTLNLLNFVLALFVLMGLKVYLSPILIPERNNPKDPDIYWPPIDAKGSIFKVLYLDFQEFRLGVLSKDYEANKLGRLP